MINKIWLLDLYVTMQKSQLCTFWPLDVSLIVSRVFKTGAIYVVSSLWHRIVQLAILFYLALRVGVWPGMMLLFSEFWSVLPTNTRSFPVARSCTKNQTLSTRLWANCKKKETGCYHFSEERDLPARQGWPSSYRFIEQMQNGSCRLDIGHTFLSFRRYPLVTHAS